MSAVTKIKLVAPVRHPGQERMYAERKMVNVGVCGRRFGKTLFGIDLLTETILSGKWRVAWFAPTYKDLAEVWREIKTNLAPIIADKDEQQHYLRFLNGSSMDCWSTDGEDSGRGRHYRRVVIDEAAKVKNLEYQWTATIQPTLLDDGGDAWIFGTPKGMNYFHSLYALGQQAENPDFKSWRMPTSENPHMDPEGLARMRRTTPAMYYQQEYEAVFIDDGSGAFRRVMEATSDALPKQEKYPGSFAMGVDWGQSNDFTVIFVIDCQTGEVVDFDRFTGIDFRTQVDRVKAKYLYWMPSQIWVERNAIGRSYADELLREGIPITAFLTTNESKQRIVQDLSLAFEQGHIRIPADPTVFNELIAFQTATTPSGLLTYRAPEGQHDDVPMALSIAWAAAKAMGAGWDSGVGGAANAPSWREVQWQPTVRR